MKIIAVLIGTRPDAIKMAPVILALQDSKNFSPFVIASAQHRELLDQVISLFGFEPDADLDIMKENQDLFYITTEMLNRIKSIIEQKDIDLLMVQGDTTTSFVSALAAFYKKIPIGHIEAGLRTYDKYQPFPEEMNRVFIDDMSDLLFAPTSWSKNNLLENGFGEESIQVTGNTGIDSLLWVRNNTEPDDFIKEAIPENKKIILLTSHRRENWGAPMRNVFEAIKEISKRNDVFILYPVHPNPKVKDLASEVLGSIENIKLIEPVNYKTMAYLLSKSYLVLTDSGGIQEEAPTFNTPVLVLRNKTERPEGVKTGVAKLVGTEKKKIIKIANNLLDNKSALKSMIKEKNPYGDGKASRRILRTLNKFFGN